MPSKIRILSEKTINQIAAGEVIESPSSVVKELIENALDANAKTITIEIRSGGFNLIKISDDGEGMSSDDAMLCFERHGTSKLENIDDLDEIVSMGFRGEALASIASIAKVTITTNTEAQEPKAVEVTCRGSKLFDPQKCARVKGTTVEVSSLFYNVPARKKFQKSAASSQASITKIVNKLALARCDVNFILKANGSIILQTTSLNDLSIRSAEVLGESFTEGLKAIDYTLGAFHVSGLIGTPQTFRHNRSGQYLFINDRAVVCPIIQMAIQDVYGTFLDPRKFPIFILHITLPKQLVDVNVHPQKLEVRLRCEREIMDFLHTAISKSLMPKTAFVKSNVAFNQPEPFDRPKPIVFDQPGVKFHPPSSTKAYVPDIPLPMQRQEKQMGFDIPCELKIIGRDKSFIILDLENFSENFPKLVDKQEQGWALIHIKRLSQKILFEETMENLQKETFPQMQGLMFPITLNVSSHEAKFLLTSLSIWKKLGIDIRSFGENTFIIESLSPRFDNDQVQTFIHEAIALIENTHVDRLENLHYEKLARLKASYCAPYEYKEEKSLRNGIENLQKYNKSLICPFQKNIIVYVDKYGIEQLFEKNPASINLSS